MNNKKGFTLIELLVVVLIIGILAAMALPQYFKAVERSRMGEAVTLLANIAQAQQRKYLQINKYTEDYRGLDVAPKGATGPLYYTKGDPVAGTNGNGFGITLAGTDFTAGIGTADRHSSNGTLQYDYQLKRYYAQTGTSCTGLDTAGNGAALCADFCGIDYLDSGKWCCSDGSTANGGADFDSLAGACTKPTSNDIPSSNP